MSPVCRSQSKYLNPIRAFQDNTTWDQEVNLVAIRLARKIDSIINTLDNSTLITRTIPAVSGFVGGSVFMFHNDSYRRYEPSLELLTSDWNVFCDTFVMGGFLGASLALLASKAVIAFFRGSNQNALNSLEASALLTKSQHAFTQAILKNYFNRLPEVEREEKIEDFLDLMPDVGTIFSRVIIEQMTVCPDRPTIKNTPSFLHSELKAIWELQDRFKKLPRKFRRKFSLLSDLPKKGPVTEIGLLKTGIIRVAGQWLYNYPELLLPLVKDEMPKFQQS